MKLLDDLKCFEDELVISKPKRSKVKKLKKYINSRENEKLYRMGKVIILKGSAINSIYIFLIF